MTDDAPRDGNGTIESIDDEYFESEAAPRRVFDVALLRQPLAGLHRRVPLVFSPKVTISHAMKAMQREHRGCVLATEDGTHASPLLGIFTERDVLLRIIDRGHNPATHTLGEVMTADPECLPAEASVAWALNRMEVGGFRHIPVVDQGRRPLIVVSMKDIVGFLVAAFPEEVLNLPPEFGADRYSSRDGA